MSTPSVAELLDTLFKTYRKPDGSEYSYAEVAQRMADAFGGSMTPAYLSKLRNGIIKNPGREALLLLCRFFQVPPDFFFPELTQLPPEDRLTEQLRTVLRQAGLTPEVQAYLEGLVTAIRQQSDRG